MKKAGLLFAFALMIGCSGESEVDYPYFKFVFRSESLNPVQLRSNSSRLYFLDSGTGQVWSIDPDEGYQAERVGPMGYAFDVSESQMAVASFSGENRVDVYDLSGNIKESAIIHGQAPLRPRFGPDGKLFVARLDSGDGGPLLEYDPDSGSFDTVLTWVCQEFCVSSDAVFYYDPDAEKVVKFSLVDSSTSSFWTGKPGMPDAFLHQVCLDVSRDGSQLLVSPLLILDTRTGVQTPLHSTPYDRGTELEGSVAWQTNNQAIYFNAMEIESGDSSDAESYSYPWTIWLYMNPE